MATQSPTAIRLGRKPAPDPAAWRAWHLFYHGARERLVAEVVRPTVASLQADRDITSFYFVRYNLGGPHIRLRLRPAPGRQERVEAKVQRAVMEFFEREPSTKSLSAETILRGNAGIAASDPLSGGTADDVHPDNSIREFPVFFEVERYGGPTHFRHSLDFFTLSSDEALRFVSGEPERPAGQRLVIASRLLIDQAWGFAKDHVEFLDLLGYASRLFTGEWTARFIQRGNEAFERQGAVHTRLLQDELKALIAADETPRGGLSPALAVGARRLARSIRRENRGTRWIITASQLHMTANRLGLLNPEELYLGQILSRAAQELATAEPEFWRTLWRRR